MIKFTYRDGAQEITKEFTKYQDLIRFVALNRIKDEDFIKLQFGADDSEPEVIEGIDGLVDKAIKTADDMDAFDAMVESMDFEEDEETEEE